MTDRTIRWAGIAGVVFVVLILVTVFATGQPPQADDPIDKIRTFFVDHRSGLIAANLAGLVAIPFVLWFGAVLRELFRGDDTSRLLGTISYIGLAVTAPLAMIAGGIQTSAVYVDGGADKFGEDTLRVMYSASVVCFAATAAGILTFAVAAALAVRRTNALPAYVMWLAWLAALGNVVALFSATGAGATQLGLPGVLTFALFILVTGITMATGKAKPAVAA